MPAARVQQVGALVILLFVLSGASLVLSQGVNDAFYFDDYSNLSSLGVGGGVDDLESARQFVLGNVSGKTGRPVAMLSFLINDNSWPSNASSFKNTNIAVHAIIGLLIFWFVLIFDGLKNKDRAHWVALFVASAWLLSPLHVSTVLYPVQRMAQLSALFSILSLIFYLKGRICLQRGEFKRAAFLIFMVVISFLLAVYSKENGALIPILIGIIELWISRYIAWQIRWLRRAAWACIILGGFILFSVVLIVVSNNGFFEQYPGRDFSPYQRLITQPQILFFYLKELFFPSLYTTGLYYDDFSAVSSFFSTIKTALYSIALVVLIFISVRLFRRRFYTGFALIFFLGGHALESSVLNLELIFEHRNYLPSAFLGFVWLDICSKLTKFSKLSYLVLLVPIIVFPLFLYERSRLWEDEVVFGKYLAESRPESIRSHVELNNSLLKVGMTIEAKNSIDHALEMNPSNVYLAMHALLVDCVLDEVDKENLDHLLDLAGKIEFDGRNRLALEKLYLYMDKERCGFLTPGYFSKLIKQFRIDKPSSRRPSPASKRLLDIYSNRFYINYPSYSPYDVLPFEQILQSRDPEYLMSAASQLANVAQYREALILGEKALKLVREGQLGSSSRSQKSFEKVILEFLAVVRDDIE